MADRRTIRAMAPLMLLLDAVRNPGCDKLNVDRAIALAEALEARLAERGYGPVAPSGPRPMVDHLGALSPELRRGFDLFWSAYALKKGMQGAALRWGQIAPDPTLAARIAAAAGVEASRPRSVGEVRKWAQGWLAERRWEDAPLPGEAPSIDPLAERAQKIRDLLGERAHLAMLFAAHASPDLAAQLAVLDTRLKELGIAIDTVAAARAERSKGSVRGMASVAERLRRLKIGKNEEEAE